MKQPPLYLQPQISSHRWPLGDHNREVPLYVILQKNLTCMSRPSSQCTPHISCMYTCVDTSCTYHTCSCHMIIYTCHMFLLTCIHVLRYVSSLSLTVHTTYLTVCSLTLHSGLVPTASRDPNLQTADSAVLVSLAMGRPITKQLILPHRGLRPPDLIVHTPLAWTASPIAPSLLQRHLSIPATTVPGVMLLWHSPMPHPLLLCHFNGPPLNLMFYSWVTRPLLISIGTPLLQKRESEWALEWVDCICAYCLCTSIWPEPCTLLPFFIIKLPELKSTYSRVYVQSEPLVYPSRLLLILY